jgi:hypothetical protein
MITLILLAQITTTAPRLAPAEAVSVLRASRSELDRTNAIPLESLDGATWVSTTSKPGDGPFGPFPKQAFRPLGVHYVHGITYRLPRPARVEHRVPITAQGRTR